MSSVSIGDQQTQLIDAFLQPPVDIKTLPPSEFQAHWPHHLQPTIWKKVWEVILIIFAAIIFPIGIVLLINKILRDSIAKQVLPAAFFPEKPNDLGPDDLCRECWDDNRAELLKDPNTKRLTITSPDGVNLDCLYHKRPDLEVTDPTIIFCNGNGEGYEIFDFTDAERENVNFFRFNYRGVGRSAAGPLLPHSLLIDAISAVQYVHEHLGVPYNKILIWGHSLGGYIGIHAAAHFQGECLEDCMHYCADRTFSTFATVTRNVVTENVGACFGNMLETIVEWCGWDYNALILWEKLRGHKWIIYNPNDRIISPESSLIRGLIERLGISLDTLTYLKMSVHRREHDPHNRPFEPEEQQFHSLQIQIALGRTQTQQKV